MPNSQRKKRSWQANILPDDLSIWRLVELFASQTGQFADAIYVEDLLRMHSDLLCK
jgi:hypothetical protein